MKYIYILKFRCLNFITKRLIHIYGNNRNKFPEKFAKMCESVYFEHHTRKSPPKPAQEKVPSAVWQEVNSSADEG